MGDKLTDAVPDDIDDDWSLSRRHALATAGAMSAAGLAGCLGGGGDDTPTEGSGGGGGDDSDDSGGGGDDSDDSDDSGGGSGEVHFLTDYNNEAWQAKWEDNLVPGFEESTNYTVRMEYSGFSGSQESRLANLVQSGDPPELNSSTFEQIGDLFAADALENVGDVVNSAEETSGELVSAPYSEGDDMWEFPHGAYVGVLHYREDVYEELGLEEPDTFQELLENARIIDESDMDIRGYGLAGSKVGKAHDEFQTFLANMGASELSFTNPDADDLSEAEVEVSFPEEEIVTLLEYLKELSQYSPDPTGIGWGTSLRNWAGGQFAQQYNLNMWPGGVAASAGVSTIAENTGVTAMPLWEEGGITSREDSELSNPTMDGHHLFSNAGNPQGGRRLLEWLYAEDGARAARMYETEPTRFLPAYSDTLGSDAFQNYGLWEDFPGLLEKLQYVSDTVLADYYGNNDEPGTLTNSPIGVYYYRFFHQAEMVNQVVTDTATPQEAYEFGLQRANEIVEEARNQMR
jgi:multiple sugar transport system substrate-binding protein